MKRVISLILCLMLVLGMATTASAATVINDTSTHSYKAYQIFTGSQDAGKSELGDVQWGNGVDGPALLADLKATYSSMYSSVESAAGVSGVLAISSENMDYLEDARKFADVAAKHIIEANGIEIPAGATSVDLPAGYYLIVDITDVEDTADAANPALLQVTNKGDIHIQQKYTVPTPDKKIVHGTQETTQDEHSIGDTINFKLSAKLPNNLVYFDTYKLIFHDNMSKGLTFQNDITVSFVNTSGDGATTETVDSSLYTITSATQADGSTLIDITFTDVKAISGIKSEDTIVIHYSAILNENAVINNPGNPNEMHLEFDNDPNWVPTTPGEEPPTGVTPPKTVIVYTTEVEITKKSGTDGSILTGAEFEITGTSANIVVTTGKVYVPYAAGETVDPANSHWLLKDKTYTITNPSGMGVDTSVYEDTTTIYKLVDKYALDTQAATPVRAKAFVSDDGKIKFTGLGVGTYTITETVTPKGYNSIQPITLHITYEDGAFKYAWGGGIASNTNPSVVVFNNQGSTLPETGGMGTTLFYVVGGLLTAAAAILLITKKRMSAEV